MVFRIARRRARAVFSRSVSRGASPGARGGPREPSPEALRPAKKSTHAPGGVEKSGALGLESGHRGETIVMRLTVRAVLATALALLASVPARAVEPKPGEDRISLEPRVTPEIVPLPDAPMLLCVTNVNRRTAPGLELIPEDT